ncbi:MAG: hypothetical protein N3C61_00295 [Candidatus Micrarchaeota archaeon]|nr:hypothetical protein [Candidatus Micrarchaeota archaeon]
MNGNTLHRNEFVERYKEYLKSKYDETCDRFRKLVDKGLIKIERSDLDIEEFFRKEVENTLKRYNVPKESQVTQKLARFANWNKMKEGGSNKEITDQELQSSKGIILFYYSKPVAPHVVVDLNMLGDPKGNPNPIISLGDYLYYKKIALLAELAGKNVIIADESRYILQEWNTELPRYPILSSPVDNKLVRELKRRYGIPHGDNIQVMYCDQAGVEWLSKRIDIISIIHDYSFTQEKLDIVSIVRSRVERWIDDPNIAELMVKYLVLSQELVLGKYRRIPEGYIHISITGKKSGRYELKTTTDINPNYGVAFVKNYPDNPIISILPLPSLLGHVQSTGMKIKLIIYNLEDGGQKINLYLFAPEQFMPESIESLTKYIFEKSVDPSRSNTSQHHLP